MQIDKTPYDDLSVFTREEESSIFQKLNFTRTRGGKDWLLEYFNNPFSNLKLINETQKIITLIIEHEADWPLTISNGTLMVMEKFYETAIDEMPGDRNLLNATAYK